MNEEEKNRLIEALEKAGLTVTMQQDPQPYAPFSRESMDALERAYYQALRERDEAREEARKYRSSDEEIRIACSLHAKHKKELRKQLGEALSSKEAWKLAAEKARKEVAEAREYREEVRVALLEARGEIKALEATNAQLRTANQQLAKQNEALKAANIRLAEAAIDRSSGAVEPFGTDLLGKRVKINIGVGKGNEATITDFHQHHRRYRLEFDNGNIFLFPRENFELLPE